MNGPADIEFRRNGEVAVALLPSDVEISRINALRRALFEAVENRDHALVLDLSATEYLDSSGVNMFYDLAESLAARQIRTALVLPAGGLVERVIQIVDLGSTMPIFRDVDSAVAGVRER